MGIMVYSSLWVMQDLHHQPYHSIVVLGHDVLPFPPGRPDSSLAKLTSPMSEGKIKA